MKNIRFILVVMLVSMISMLAFFFGYRSVQQKKLKIYSQRVTDYLISQMDTEAMVRQLLVIFLDPRDQAAIEKHAPGGIFLYTSTIPVGENGRQDIATLTASLQKINQLYADKNLAPPLYSIDQEGGLVKRLLENVTLFPSSLAVGEAVSQESNYDLAMLVGFYTCRDLRKTGIQWNFAPVADVQQDPENPIIRIRSYGSQPDLVSRVTAAYIEGMRAGRCLDTLKHFPGHGDTSIDSHTDLPTISKPAAELEKTDLAPFQYLIADKNSVPGSVMTAHIVFDRFSADPATLSPYWLTEVLRQKWQYDGIVISDDMGMKALAGFQNKYRYSPEVQSFLAGADMLLIFNGIPGGLIERSLASFREAIANGDISRQRLETSVRRILLKKLELGVLDPLLEKMLAKADNRELEPALKLLLKHSAALNHEAEDIETRLPSPESINRVASRRGIKLLQGTGPLPDSANWPLYTDAPAGSELWQKLAEKHSRIYPLQSLKEITENTLIFNSQRDLIKPVLATVKRQPDLTVLLYTVENPYPWSSLGKLLQSRDLLIDSFSDTPESIQALAELFLQNQLPEKSRAIYQP